MKFAALIVFLLALGAVLLPAKAQALTISPVRTEIAADPGSTIRGELLLINEQEGTRTFYSSFGNFEATGETGTPTFVEGLEGLATWIETVPQITLEQGEQTKVPYTIQVPADADPGGHFAAIFWSTVPPAGAEGGVAIGAKVGSLILLRISGEFEEGGALLEFGPREGKRVFGSLPVVLSYRFQNGGGDRLKPEGTLTVKSFFFFPAAKLNANIGEGNVLPESIRKFDVVWRKDQSQRDLSPKELERETGFLAGLKNEWQNFALGVYTAKLDITYGTEGEGAKASTTFFVLPWRILSIALIIFLILGFLSRIGIKRYNKWIIAKAQQGQGLR